jgi:hypothetical protein
MRLQKDRAGEHESGSTRRLEDQLLLPHLIKAPGCLTFIAAWHVSLSA